MLHEGAVHRSVREALSYQLDTFEFEYIAVTAPTRSAGTPHEHIYLWVEDPENEVGTSHIKPALNKHIKYCTNALMKHHRFRRDGTDGAIRVQQDPDLLRSIPEKVQCHTGHRDSHNGSDEALTNTAGAQYIASQLAHLPVGDFCREDQSDPPDALIEGAALAWTSPRNWFRASRGVPTL